MVILLKNTAFNTESLVPGFRNQTFYLYIFKNLRQEAFLLASQQLQ